MSVVLVLINCRSYILNVDMLLISQFFQQVVSFDLLTIASTNLSVLGLSPLGKLERGGIQSTCTSLCEDQKLPSDGFKEHGSSGEGFRRSNTATG